MNLKKLFILLTACALFCLSTSSCGPILERFRNAIEPEHAVTDDSESDEESHHTAAREDADEKPANTYSAGDDDEVDIVYTTGYSTLLNPDLSTYDGLTTYTLTDSVGYTYTVPIIDGSDIDGGDYYVDALYNSTDLYYEVVDGTGYTPDTYMQAYAVYLIDYFASDSTYTSCTLSDIYVTADNSLALIATYYDYDGDFYYDIMGVANTASSDFVYFDFIYMEDYTTGDLLTMIETILGYTGIW